MRVLDKNEVSEVSGGTFCLVGGLISGIFSLLKKPKTVCAPVHAPAPCKPAKRHGC